MSAWYWCPCCGRAFEAKVPKAAVRSSGAGLGQTGPLRVGCPFNDCGASARWVMPWEKLRRWAAMNGEDLPAVPRDGAFYPIPLPDVPATLV